MRRTRRAGWVAAAVLAVGCTLAKRPESASRPNRPAATTAADSAANASREPGVLRMVVGAPVTLGPDSDRRPFEARHEQPAAERRRFERVLAQRRRLAGCRWSSALRDELPERQRRIHELDASVEHEWGSVAQVQPLHDPGDPAGALHTPVPVRSCAVRPQLHVDERPDLQHLPEPQAEAALAEVDALGGQWRVDEIERHATWQFLPLEPAPFLDGERGCGHVGSLSYSSGLSGHPQPV